jgi:hypothetical protein
VPRQPSDDWWRAQGYSQEPGIGDGSRPDPDFHEEEDFQEGVEDGGQAPYIPITVATRSTAPRRPRTIGAGYDPDSMTLAIQFRSPTNRGTGDDGAGAIYHYQDVTAREWYDIKRVVSAGKFINRRLAGKDYTRVM